MATTMFYSEDFDGALSEFKKILQVEPGRPQALFNIGVAYLHGKNDPKSALESWERLVALNPNYPQVGLVKEQIAAPQTADGRRTAIMRKEVVEKLTAVLGVRS